MNTKFKVPTKSFVLFCSYWVSIETKKPITTYSAHGYYHNVIIITIKSFSTSGKLNYYPHIQQHQTPSGTSYSRIIMVYFAQMIGEQTDKSLLP